MEPNYSKPHKEHGGHNNFLHGDANRERERKEIKQANSNPATYIEKEGKLVPVTLKEYRKHTNSINEEARKKRQEIEDMFRKMFGHTK